MLHCHRVNIYFSHYLSELSILPFQKQLLQTAKKENINKGQIFPCKVLSMSGRGDITSRITCLTCDNGAVLDKATGTAVG